jgi:hypothetical protein
MELTVDDIKGKEIHSRRSGEEGVEKMLISTVSLLKRHEHWTCS